ncbi:MAG: MATE family efflux transporter [Caldilineaceae bacterium]|nr:MATE family efflux transporter [Caldilineaceae bacterium]
MQTSQYPATAARHPFVSRPHRTVLALSVPVLVSLIAEPLTGLVDTAFVAQLGAVPLAALGVGTAALTSIFWIFNFLGIGSQTEVAQALGRERPERAARVAGLAFVLSLLFGGALILVGYPAAGWISGLLGADGVVRDNAVAYMNVRLLGAPAVLALLSAFGVLRGQQDMRTPLWIAVALNALNIVLDALLVRGWGPIPAFGVAGVAAASTVSQWAGALWAVTLVLRRLGWPHALRVREAGRLLRVGGDLFLRTGLLTFFLLLATRTATLLGPESGAAHQAIRQFWIFAALGLDALAITAQSLVGFFIGAGWVVQARRVAAVASLWGILLGVLLGSVMWFGRTWIAALLVPASAQPVFFSAWLLAAVIQPVNALAFVTDGIHWGTGDFRYLRNVMVVATGAGAVALLVLEGSGAATLFGVWLISNLWIAVRSTFGVLRVWPAIGDSPFRVVLPARSVGAIGR